MPVSVSGDALRIDGFETSERDIVSYFIGLPDSENMDKKLETLLKLESRSQIISPPEVQLDRKAF